MPSTSIYIPDSLLRDIKKLREKGISINVSKIVQVALQEAVDKALSSEGGRKERMVQSIMDHTGENKEKAEQILQETWPGRYT